MAQLTNPLSPTKANESNQEGRDQFILSCFSVMFVTGLFVDGWAHYHGYVDDSFFTPWHAVLYGSFGLTAAWIGWVVWKRYRVSENLREAFASAYRVALFGVVGFAVGGVGDMIWHTLFGIEQNIEALISPTHLLLAISGGLMITGPLQNIWGKSADAPYRNATVVLSASALLSVLTFFTAYIHPIVEPVMLAAPRRWNKLGVYNAQIVGTASVMIQTALLVGVVFYILKRSRWQLPFGSLTTVLTLNGLAMSVLQDYYGLVWAWLLAGLIGDVLLSQLDIANKSSHMRLFAITLPMTLWAGFFLLAAQMGHFEWSIHMWNGNLVLSGIIGFFISMIASPEQTSN